MNALTMFQFDAAQIRVIQAPDGEPLFVAKDVAIALGYADFTNAIKQHCRGGAKHHPLPTAGGMQTVRVIAEPDVLRLIVKSHLPSAERFEKLVFEEILPTIRKTGRYDSGSPGFAVPQTLPEALRLAADALEQKQVAEAKALALEHKTAEQAAKIQEDAPKLDAFDRLCKAEGSICLRDGAKALHVTERFLIGWLHGRGWIYRRQGNGRWVGHADKERAGYLTHKTVTYFNQQTAEDRVTEQVRITAKGLARLAVLLNAETQVDRQQQSEGTPCCSET